MVSVQQAALSPVPFGPNGQGEHGGDDLRGTHADTDDHP